MGRRRSAAKRFPSGKPHRQPQLPAPIEARRMMEAAAVGMRDSVWGSMLGMLYVSGKLTSVQFQAGRRWTELISGYSLAMQAPKPPRSALLVREGGAAADVDSERGCREVKRHEIVIDGYLGGHRALEYNGPNTIRIVNNVCELNLFPVGLSEMEILREGLQLLAALWASEHMAVKKHR